MVARHPLFAPLYARISVAGERHGMAEHRDEMLRGLTGRVVEVGAGNGLNFAHYPSSVTEVVAIKPEPYLRERARAAAASAPVPTATPSVRSPTPASTSSTCTASCSRPASVRSSSRRRSSGRRAAPDVT